MHDWTWTESALALHYLLKKANFDKFGMEGIICQPILMVSVLTIAILYTNKTDKISSPG
jgi:hypothetical protein